MSMYASNERGGRTGSGGAASSAEVNADRRERMRQIAEETIDLSKDPYFMRNHLGSFECRLCLTLHNTPGNYLAHTQGKRHQTNLSRRAAREAKETTALIPQQIKKVLPRRVMKIGRPGYRVIKQKDPETGQKSLLFQLEYPDIEEGVQPRYRLMSSFEQKVEPQNPAYQYILFAAEPYETVGFKIPNLEIERDLSSGKFFYDWDKDKKSFTLQLFFKDPKIVQQ